jgi:alpha-galactosidase
MTGRLGTDTVTLTLEDDGTWSAHWPAADVTLLRVRARVDLGDQDETTADGAGAWRVDGTTARWSAGGPGLEIALHVDGEVVTVTASYRASAACRLGHLAPVVGVVDVVATARLVDGYDSWAYAGVVDGARAGDSWWNSAIVAADGRALALQALAAARFATRVSHVDDMVIVECGGTPSARFVDGTWGYEVLEPELLALPLEPGEEVRSEPVAIAAGTDAVALVDDLAARAGRSARRWGGPPIAGWESWYHYGLRIDADAFLANTGLLRARFGESRAFDVAQLDDGWQVGHGAWEPNDKFPADLGELTAAVHDRGARAGLWLAPFMVERDGPGVGTEHPDWCLRHESGQPLRDRHGKWALDASHPDALEWLAALGVRVREWGFDMVKLDFLYLGAQEAGRHDARVTGTEALRRGLGAFVDGLGDTVYVLGCGMPMLPALGICHGNRVGPDLATPVLHREFGQPVPDRWSGWYGVQVQARNVAARFALHHWYDCDPDVVLAWGSDGATPDGYSLEDSRALATMAACCGGPFFLADDLAALTTDERAVLEDPEVLDLLPEASGAGFRPLDLFARPEAPPVEHAFAPATSIAQEWVTRRHGDLFTARFAWDVPAGERRVRVTRART